MDVLHLSFARPREPPTRKASAGWLLQSAVAQRAKAGGGDPGAKKKAWMPAFAGMSGKVRKWTR